MHSAQVLIESRRTATVRSETFVSLVRLDKHVIDNCADGAAPSCSGAAREGGV